MNSLDLVVIVVMILSIALSVLRGVVREVLSIAAWVGAVFVGLYGLPLVRPLAQRFIDSPQVADIAAGVSLGLFSLIIFSLVSNRVSKLVKGAGLGAVDRSLGAVFGAVRGAVLLSLLYMLLTFLMPPQMPDWVTTAKAEPLLSDGADMLRSLVPASLASSLPPVPPLAPETNDMPPPPPVPVPPTAPKTDDQDHGYKDKERGDLGRLIENTERAK